MCVCVCARVCVCVSGWMDGCDLHNLHMGSLLTLQCFKIFNWPIRKKNFTYWSNEQWPYTYAKKMWHKELCVYSMYQICGFIFYSYFLFKIGI